MIVVLLSQMENCLIVKDIKKQCTLICSPLNTNITNTKTSGCLLLPKAWLEFSINSDGLCAILYNLLCYETAQVGESKKYCSSEFLPMGGK